MLMLKLGLIDGLIEIEPDGETLADGDKDGEPEIE